VKHTTEGKSKITSVKTKSESCGQGRRAVREEKPQRQDIGTRKDHLSYGADAEKRQEGEGGVYPAQRFWEGAEARSQLMSWE